MLLNVFIFVDLRNVSQSSSVSIFSPGDIKYALLQKYKKQVILVSIIPITSLSAAKILSLCKIL